MSVADATAQSASTSDRIDAYVLAAEGDAFRLERRPIAFPALGPRDLRVRIKAASLNYRDLLVVRGQYGRTRTGLVPLSDAAGVVEAVGTQVTRWQIGDRVAPIFFRDWATGPFRPEYGASGLGGGDMDGVLAGAVVVGEDALVRVADHLTDEEAGTLACAGVTAYHALVVRGRVGPSSTVLVQGTGGVALFGLQIAQALGARVIVTSSSDEKLARARDLGAWGAINYRTRPDWHDEILRLTGGAGVTHVLELGGPGTFDRSLQAVAAGGAIAQIGVLTGFGPQSNLMRLQLVNADIHGINVGSGEHFAGLNDLLAKHRIRPVIDRVFPFDEVPAAYEHFGSGVHFGKVVVSL